jgi:hypothetical protein
MKTYKGTYKLKKPEKYLGDPDKVVYRSGWERTAFRWVEANPNITGWAAEEVVIPYRCATDNRMHRYFIDLYFETTDGRKFLIEIKPDKQTKPPVPGKRRTKKYITESLTYAKNKSKWNAATEFAADNGCSFVIWTEKTMKGLGMKIL